MNINIIVQSMTLVRLARDRGAAAFARQWQRIGDALLLQMIARELRCVPGQPEQGYDIDWEASADEVRRRNPDVVSMVPAILERVATVHPDLLADLVDRNDLELATPLGSICHCELSPSAIRGLMMCWASSRIDARSLQRAVASLEEPTHEPSF